MAKAWACAVGQDLEPEPDVTNVVAVEQPIRYDRPVGVVQGQDRWIQHPVANAREEVAPVAPVDEQRDDEPHRDDGADEDR